MISTHSHPRSSDKIPNKAFTMVARVLLTYIYIIFMSWVGIEHESNCEWWWMSILVFLQVKMSVVEGGGEPPTLIAPATTPTSPPAAPAGTPVAHDGFGPIVQVHYDFPSSLNCFPRCHFYLPSNNSSKQT